MSRQENRPNAQEIFTNAVAKGPVFDKDRAAESLSHLRELLAGANITGRNLKKVVLGFERQMSEGGVKDQIKAVDTIEEACSGLSKANSVINHLRE